MSDTTLNVIDGVEITKEMVDLYAMRFGVDATANMPGILGSLAMWIRGQGELDSYLTDSNETHMQFANLRKAYFNAKGMNAEPARSKVSFLDVVPNYEPGEGTSSRPGVAGQPDPRPLATERQPQFGEPVPVGQVSQVHADGTAVRPEEGSAAVDAAKSQEFSHTASPARQAPVAESQAYVQGREMTEADRKNEHPHAKDPIHGDHKGKK